MSTRDTTPGLGALVSPFALIRGTPGPDDLETLADGDSLFGLAGGGGSDLLRGGAGADVMVVDLRPGRTGVLTLADFERTADLLEFVGLADAGAPGPIDDLDALAEFEDAGAGGLLEVTLGGAVLRLPGWGTGAEDLFA